MSETQDQPLPHPLITWVQAGVSPRWFVAVIGGLLLLTALIALAGSVTADYDAGMFGRQEVTCGSALSPDTDMYSGAPEGACADALSARRAWGWPVGGVGALAVLGAAVVRTPRQS